MPMEAMNEIVPTGSGVREIVTYMPDGSGMMTDPAQAAQYFAQLSPPELAEGAARRLVAEPSGPNSTPPRVSWERWGSVPRLYVQCLQDRAIPIVNQRRMIELAPGTETITLDADHSPFYSDTEALAEALIGAAERIG
jgi:pimeloyl-ACP methyl ester carboxylesterase